MLTKTEIREFQKVADDYVPRGGRQLTREETRALRFRPTSETEIYHCGIKTGDDLQSGPYYCGDLADYVAPGPGGVGVVAVCGRHKRKLERL